MENRLAQPILPPTEQRIGLFFGKSSSLFNLVRDLTERAMTRAVIEECVSEKEVKDLYLNGLQSKDKVI